MSVSAELLTRYENERWTPLPEKPVSETVEQLLHNAIHLLAQALNERNPQ